MLLVELHSVVTAALAVAADTFALIRRMGVSGSAQAFFGGSSQSGLALVSEARVSACVPPGKKH